MLSQSQVAPGIVVGELVMACSMMRKQRERLVVTELWADPVVDQDAPARLNASGKYLMLAALIGRPVVPVEQHALNSPQVPVDRAPAWCSPGLAPRRCWRGEDVDGEPLQTNANETQHFLTPPPIPFEIAHTTMAPASGMP